MSTNLARFLPPETRLKIAQTVIEQKGIRPLAREIEVNPKSVYKYKHGSAKPGNEVMSRILAVAKKEDSINLENYLDELRKDFLEALELSFKPQKILSDSPEASKKSSGGKKRKVKEKRTVDQQTTEKQKEKKNVDKKSTKREMTMNEILEKINVSNPFNQSKVEKTLETFSETPNPSLPEIVELSGLSEEAVEKYLDKLTSQKIVEKASEDTYQLAIEIERGS